MSNSITITAADGHPFSAYAAGDPGSHRGIVLVQEIFGVNEHIRNVADRYAKGGFYVLAPALFDRAQKRVELDYNEAGVSHGVGLMSRITSEQALADVRATLAHLGRRTKAIIGFCWGGTIAWNAAGQIEDLSCAVGLYGGGIAANRSKQPQCPVQLHFGEQDPHIPMTDVNAIRQSRPDVDIHTYANAGHGFCCDARGSFHAESAAIARTRVLAFLARHMG